MLIDFMCQLLIGVLNHRILTNGHTIRNMQIITFLYQQPLLFRCIIISFVIAILFFWWYDVSCHTLKQPKLQSYLFSRIYNAHYQLHELIYYPFSPERVTLVDVIRILPKFTHCLGEVPTISQKLDNTNSRIFFCT